MFKKLERNDPCWCGSGRKYKKCHEAFDEKIRKIQEEGHIVPGHELIKTPEQIAAIRESCAINIAVLDYVAEHIQAGISTEPPRCTVSRMICASPAAASSLGCTRLP